MEVMVTMGCDMAVALGQATIERNTLFGLNYHSFLPQDLALRRLPGRVYAADEILKLPQLDLPQARQTYTVLGNQPTGTWGLSHGINEHQVAAGFCCWQSKFPPAASALLG